MSGRCRCASDAGRRRGRPASRQLAAAGLTLLALAIGGCGGKSAAPRGPAGTDASAGAPITNTDPCAMRLHDLSGALLLYYAMHYEFPEALSDLEGQTGDLPLPPLVCPVSELPYIYDPEGIRLPERSARILVHDAAPVHSRMRWAITVEEPGADGLPATKVLALPESFFLLRPPR